MIDNTYFSGQGKIYLAKYLDDKNYDKFRFIGNAYNFVIESTKLDENSNIKVDKFRLHVDCLSNFNAEFIFGELLETVDLPVVSGELKDYKTYNFRTSKSLPSYYLVLEGVNSVVTTNYKDEHRKYKQLEAFRIDLPKVKFTGLDNCNPITDQLTSFALVGEISSNDGSVGYFSIK